MRQPLACAVLWLSNKMRVPSFVVAQWGTDELLAQLAYHRLQDDDFKKQVEFEREQERIAAMSPKERAEYTLSQLGVDLSLLKKGK